VIAIGGKEGEDSTSSESHTTPVAKGGGGKGEQVLIVANLVTKGGTSILQKAERFPGGHRTTTSPA